jgi:hypothetical protein
MLLWWAWMGVGIAFLDVVKAGSRDTPSSDGLSISSYRMQYHLGSREID